MTEVQYTLQQLVLLVVDDQDPMRKSIKRLGQSMGFGEVIECNDGESAIKVMEERTVDLVITDLYMKKVNGIKLLEYIRSRDMDCDIPVIIVTGESGHDDIVKAADSGAKDYLLKPFHINDLEKKIARALDQYFSPSSFLKDLRKGERLYLKGEIQQAKILFESATQQDPSSARATHGLALSCLKLGLNDIAISLLQKCTTLNPSFYRAYGTLADTYLQKGQVKKAMVCMLRELKINPKRSSRQIQLGHLLLKHGQADQAILHYRLALKEDPKKKSALMGMGQAMASVGKLDKALYYFRRVRRYDPTSSKALEAGIRACVSSNDWRKAEIFLKDERAAHPSQLDSSMLLATLFFKQGRSSDALNLSNDLLAKQPHIPEILQIKSTALLNLEAYDEALPILVELGTLAPSSQILIQIARLYIRAGRDADALSYLHQSLALGESQSEPFWLLAERFRANRYWIQAALMYRRAKDLGASPEECLKGLNDCLQHAQQRKIRSGNGSMAS